ncbi:MAG: NAD(P)/FAD-dependent oxidoreductase [Candidatus Nanoarchaeia archaeon]
MKVVIIGGGSAGTTCAYELRKLDKEAEITVLEKTQYTQYSPCALPYFLSGEINFDDMFIFDLSDYQNNNINLVLNATVYSVDKENRIVFYKEDSNEKQLHYDKLVIATGSSNFIPPIKGIENANYYTLKTIEDAKTIAKNIESGKHSVIIGAGVIGVELGAALAEHEKVSLIEAKESILPGMFDSDMAKLIKKHLQAKGITIFEGTKINEIADNCLFLNEEQINYDKLFLSTGVQPNTKLAQETGLGVDKGIKVNEYMQTNDENIYACGDCAESCEFYSKKSILSQLGTTAVRQAKTIATNIAGIQDKFPPVVNNTISKIGELYAGAVGITQQRAKESNINAISAKYTGNVRSEYYSTKEKITIKLVCDLSGTLIGGQIIGDSEVVGRLNLIALAIQKQCHVSELASLETCYNPPCAPIFDPLSIASEICLKKLKMRGK